MLDLKEQTFSFKCPQCRQFISSAQDECKFCQTTLSPETKQFAIENQKSENRQYRFRNHLKHLVIGIAVFFGSLLLNALILFGAAQGGSHHVFIFYGIVLYGFAELCYGGFGLIQDLRDKYKNV